MVSQLAHSLISDPKDCWIEAQTITKGVGQREPKRFLVVYSPKDFDRAAVEEIVCGMQGLDLEPVTPSNKPLKYNGVIKILQNGAYHILLADEPTLRGVFGASSSTPVVR